MLFDVVNNNDFENGDTALNKFHESGEQWSNQPLDTQAQMIRGKHFFAGAFGVLVGVTRLVGKSMEGPPPPPTEKEQRIKKLEAYLTAAAKNGCTYGDVWHQWAEYKSLVDPPLSNIKSAKFYREKIEPLGGFR